MITNFSVNVTFDEAYKNAEVVDIDGEQTMKWRVLSLEDLIVSKIKSDRPKDLLDIQELKRINKF